MPAATLPSCLGRVTAASKKPTTSKSNQNNIKIISNNIKQYQNNIKIISSKFWENIQKINNIKGTNNLTLRGAP